MSTKLTFLSLTPIGSMNKIRHSSLLRCTASDRGTAPRHRRIPKRPRPTLTAKRTWLFPQVTLNLWNAVTGTAPESRIPGRDHLKPVGEERKRMLLGKITARELYEKYPVFAENASAYKPDSRIVERIGRLDGDTAVVMFLGTWCGDSVREVPRFLKLIESADNPRISLVMYGLDKSLDDGEGIAHEYNIERVPTMVFLREDREVGRLVEPPDGTMEKDLLRVLGLEGP